MCFTCESFWRGNMNLVPSMSNIFPFRSHRAEIHLENTGHAPYWRRRVTVLHKQSTLCPQAKIPLKSPPFPQKHSLIYYFICKNIECTVDRQHTHADLAQNKIVEAHLKYKLLGMCCTVSFDLQFKARPHVGAIPPLIASLWSLSAEEICICQCHIFLHPYYLGCSFYGYLNLILSRE